MSQIDDLDTGQKRPYSNREGRLPRPPQQLSKTDFDRFLKQLQTPLRPTSVAPTYTPQNFLEQFVLYESGATRRLYTWVAGTWRYATLT